MTKSLAALLSASILILLSSLQLPHEDISATVKVPGNVKGGEEFQVSVTVYKKNISGFARLQQFLPEGFAAEPIETANAQFIEDGNSIKFIWIQLPASDSFTVSYSVKSLEESSGLKVITGVFIYIEDEKTRQFALQPAEIIFGTAHQPTLNQSAPTVDRKLWVTAAEKNEYQVELTISPNTYGMAAKYVDNIPEGFEASLVEAQGGTFLFADNKVIFSWPVLPQGTFKISYLVRSAKSGETPNIDGMLVYGHSAKNLEIDSSTEETDMLRQAIQSSADPADNIIAELFNSEKNKESIAMEAAREKKIPQITLAAPGPISTPALSSTPGIYYKVQIAATIRSPERNTEFFRKRHGIEDFVELTYHEGWKKYLIGTCPDYKSAQDLRKKTVINIPDAFIVAYNNGIRISVKEALEIASLTP
ncbi:MAG: hypothetical protein DWQ44_08760 [Bacteroidetes bacterium]|nr:MAG: hypothetical protein DWQ44_08760 [Bacteroidota bacterium]